MVDTHRGAERDDRAVADDVVADDAVAGDAATGDVAAGHVTHREGVTRRQFVSAGAGAVAAGAVGAVAGSVGSQLHPAPLPDLPTPTAAGFDHVVVVMFENRSFDNVFGWLYEPKDLGDDASFAGLAFGNVTNLASDGTPVKAHRYEGTDQFVFSSPRPDPGEEYPHVNTQLFGTILPESNFGEDVAKQVAPFNLPDDASTPAMSGFVLDWESHVTQLSGAAPTAAQRRRIMGGFSPEQLPVLSTLAKEFAVFDQWFCAVPSQTFCNRSFFHASTSHGFVTNHLPSYAKWLNAPAAPTIFNRLEDAGVSWRIYFDKDQLVSMTGLIHAPALEQYWKTEHFAPMDQFYLDAKAGALPAYAFIEPRMVYNHNDFHPPFGKLEVTIDGDDVVTDSAVSDVRAGEVLARDVYTAIRTSQSHEGSNALNTLLLLTFDEHGGTFDHVAPPAATVPDDSAGEMGFGFDRLGLRVPTVAISAYTAKGTIVHDPMHHGALVATLSQLHGVDPLTPRDAGATTLGVAVNRSTPRQPSTWPDPVAHPVPANSEAVPGASGEDALRPLTPPAKGLLGLLLSRYAPDTPIPDTYGKAFELLEVHGKGLFGVQD